MLIELLPRSRKQSVRKPLLGNREVCLSKLVPRSREQAVGKLRLGSRKRAARKRPSQQSRSPAAIRQGGKAFRAGRAGTPAG